MTSEKQKLNNLRQSKVEARPMSRFGWLAGSGPAEKTGDPETGTSTLPRVARPSLYKVILLNDDFTPMEFVVAVLKKFFGKTDGEAQRIMLQVHQDGSAIAGVYTFEVAETKVYLVNEYSRRHKFPLKCIMEKEEESAPADE
jgi:ATP-dependent Clp protease adaptor protein ClpS